MLLLSLSKIKKFSADDRPPNNNQSKSCRTKLKMENSSQVTSSLNKSYASAVSMQPPNRAEFERNLSETHFQIKTKEAEMTQIRGTEESLGRNLFRGTCMDCINENTKLTKVSVCALY